MNNEKLLDWMINYVDHNKFNGCSLLISQNNKILFDDGYGWIDKDKTKVFGTDTIVRIFSMTKAIVSTCLLTLLEKENIPLETKISSFITQFSECYALVNNHKSIEDVEKVSSPTVRQLLNHTSGLSYFFNEDLVATEYLEKGITTAPNNSSLKETINKLAEVPLSFRPGLFWNYSVGIDVAGRIIEIITDKSLDVFLEEFLFQPLGMKDTSFYLPHEKRNRFADCFFFKDMTQNFWPLENLYENFAFDKSEVTNLSGGSGLLSTAKDYLKFADLLKNNGRLRGKNFLSEKVIRKIRCNSLPKDIASIGVKSFAQMPTEGMGHSLAGSIIIKPNIDFPSNKNDFGWGGMGSNYFWIDFVRNVSVIFMTQLVPSSSYPNRKELKKLLID